MSVAEKEDKKQFSREGSLEYVVASKSCLSSEDLVVNTVDASISLRIRKEESKKIEKLDYSLSSKNFASDIDGEVDDWAKVVMSIV